MRAVYDVACRLDGERWIGSVEMERGVRVQSRADTLDGLQSKVTEAIQVARGADAPPFDVRLVVR